MIFSILDNKEGVIWFCFFFCPQMPLKWPVFTLVFLLRCRWWFKYIRTEYMSVASEGFSIFMSLIFYFQIIVICNSLIQSSNILWLLFASSMHASFNLCLQGFPQAPIFSFCVFVWLVSVDMEMQHYQCTVGCWLRLCITKPTSLGGFIEKFFIEPRNANGPIAWLKKENGEAFTGPELFYNQIPQSRVIRQKPSPLVLICA